MTMIEYDLHFRILVFKSFFVIAVSVTGNRLYVAYPVIFDKFHELIYRLLLLIHLIQNTAFHRVDDNTRILMHFVSRNSSIPMNSECLATRKSTSQYVSAGVLHSLFNSCRVPFPFGAIPSMVISLFLLVILLLLVHLFLL